jgi:hypothetical protein
MPRPDLQIPLQERDGYFFDSFLLKRELELRDLYDLSEQDLDIFLAEIEVEVEDELNTRPKRLRASRFAKLARLIRSDRQCSSTPQP